MSTINLRDIALHTFGELPAIGQPAPHFALTDIHLETKELKHFTGKGMLLNVYPSIDTHTCFDSVAKFNRAVLAKKNFVVAGISMDLPFTLKRVAAGECFENVVLLSDFRNREFGDLYGLTIADGPLAGLLARAVIILDPDHKVVYRELVQDISNPPSYDAAMAACAAF